MSNKAPYRFRLGLAALTVMVTGSSSAELVVPVPERSVFQLDSVDIEGGNASRSKIASNAPLQFVKLEKSDNSKEADIETYKGVLDQLVDATQGRYQPEDLFYNYASVDDLGDCIDISENRFNDFQRSKIEKAAGAVARKDAVVFIVAGLPACDETDGIIGGISGPGITPVILESGMRFPATYVHEFGHLVGVGHSTSIDQVSAASLRHEEPEGGPDSLMNSHTSTLDIEGVFSVPELDTAGLLEADETLINPVEGSYKIRSTMSKEKTPKALVFQDPSTHTATYISLEHDSEASFDIAAVPINSAAARDPNAQIVSGVRENLDLQYIKINQRNDLEHSVQVREMSPDETSTFLDTSLVLQPSRNQGEATWLPENGETRPGKTIYRGQYTGGSFMVNTKYINNTSAALEVIVT